MSRQQPEAVLRLAILAAVGSRPDVTIWNHPTGSAVSGVGAWLRFGLPGSPDIVGFTDGGLFIGLEIKTPGPNGGRQSEQQRSFETTANRRNAFYAVVRSVEDAHRAVDAVLEHARAHGLIPPAGPATTTDTPTRAA